ncbi:efflux transporter outer membrane subunit [Asticcacaulis excentricus]|uniref:RND efflux system, outer membrane lipoprotein, NodT family n=1 Tax=Asticcacaulis excentricus (strain ATCC 15261 / DSM 4724 / KCTC 12464 / NCIMB 9791 / VKM B-1370 / CB 48) TaxID=573065 RepID=E8RMY1_ASTEC|nr:efflux transporter outer membrane subunit [Asticcacaulis excentricus]ADU11744.1 RND efflux system, outer membrane lipoprotein, NodT family [Asticcacaulis excentricus CB 48]
MRIALFGLLGTCLSAIGLTACTSTPYVTPQVPVAETYLHQTAATLIDKPPSAWWTSFGDAQLNALVSTVLTHNNDLAAAGLTLKKARLTAGLSRLDKWPSLSGSVSASHAGDTSYSASLSVSYEADLYGRLNDTLRAANWEAQATAEDLAATRLALVGTTAELYWTIGYTHRQISVGQEDLAHARKVLDLVTTQHDAGAASGVDVAEAQQNVSAQEASLAALQQNLVEYRASLAVLLGGIRWDVTREPQILPQTPLPEVQAGLPADLLGQRPDLRAAEMRLREALATVDATRKSFYPTFTLSGSEGGISSELAEVLKNPSGSVAATLSLPFLDYARIHTNVRVSQTSYEIAVARFKTTWLQALADVDNALSNHTQLAQKAAAEAQALKAAQRAEALYAVQYKTGAVALRVWLDARQSARAAQLSYDNVRLAQFKNRLTLYQALGGA